MPDQAEKLVENIVPILNVRKLNEGIAFYVEKLGFKVQWRTPGAAGIARDGWSLMLVEGAQGVAWMGVEDIAPVAKDLLAKGAKFKLPPTNYSWAYEMRIEDPDGNVLRIGSEPRKDLPVVT